MGDKMNARMKFSFMVFGLSLAALATVACNPMTVTPITKTVVETGVEPPCDLWLSEAIPGEDTEVFPFGWGGWNSSGWDSPEFDATCNAAIQSLVKSGMKSPLFRGLKRPLISGKNVRWTGGGGCFRIR